MRFKVQTRSLESYDRVVRLLEASNVIVFVRSPKRRFVSTGDLPREVLSTIRTIGADITPETELSPDDGSTISRH